MPGTIAVAGGTLALGGTLTTTQLGTVTETSGAVQLNGTLNNAGTTLSLGAAASLNNFNLNGSIVGGTIADSSAALTVGRPAAPRCSTASPITARSRSTSPAPSCGCATGSTVNGTANITGAGAMLDFIGSQSFNNAHVNLGAAGTASTIELTHSTTSVGASMLSLGSSLSITQTGQFATIGAPGGVAGDSIVNSGTITAGLSMAAR